MPPPERRRPPAGAIRPPASFPAARPAGASCLRRCTVVVPRSTAASPHTTTRRAGPPRPTGARDRKFTGTDPRRRRRPEVARRRVNRNVYLAPLPTVSRDRTCASRSMTDRSTITLRIALVVDVRGHRSGRAPSSSMRDSSSTASDRRRSGRRPRRRTAQLIASPLAPLSPWSDESRRRRRAEHEDRRRLRLTSCSSGCSRSACSSAGVFGDQRHERHRGCDPERGPCGIGPRHAR